MKVPRRCCGAAAAVGESGLRQNQIGRTEETEVELAVEEKILREPQLVWVWEIRRMLSMSIFRHFCRAFIKVYVLWVIRTILFVLIPEALCYSRMNHRARSEHSSLVNKRTTYFAKSK